MTPHHRHRRWPGLWPALADRLLRSWPQPEEPVRLWLDRLEDRRVLSVSAALVAGSLIVDGGVTADDVSIQLVDAGTDHETIEVYDHGALVPITVGLGSQNSVQTTQLTGGLLQIHLGDGNDQLSLQVPTAAHLPSLSVVVDGEAGQDHVTLMDNAAAPLAQHTQVLITAENIAFGDADFHLGSVALQLNGRLEIDADQFVTLGGNFDVNGAIASPGHFDLHVQSLAGQIALTGPLGLVGAELGQASLLASGPLALADAHVLGDLSASALRLDLSGHVFAGSLHLQGLARVDGDASLQTSGGDLDLSGASVIALHPGLDNLTLSSAGALTLNQVDDVHVFHADALGPIHLLGDLQADAIRLTGAVQVDGTLHLSALTGDLDLSAAPVQAVHPGSDVLFLSAANQLSLLSAIGLLKLDAQGGAIVVSGNITTSGEQFYHGPVRVADNILLSAADSEGDGLALRFDQTIDAAAGAPSALTLQATGDIFTGGNIGAARALDGLQIDSAHNVTFAGTLRTAGDVRQLAGTGLTQFHGTNGTGIGGELDIATASAAFAGAIRTAGNVHIAVQNSLSFDAGATLNAGAAIIRFDINLDQLGAEGFSQGAGSIVRTANETQDAFRLTVGGQGDAQLAAIRVGQATGQIGITAGGAIRNASIDGPVNLIGFAAALRSGGDIGSEAPGASVRATVSQLAVDAPGAGFIRNTQALTLTNVDGIAVSQILGGGQLAANGRLEITSNVRVGGDFTFRATGTGLQDELVVAANVTHVQGDGGLRFVSADDILLASGDISNVNGGANLVQLRASRDELSGLDTILGNIQQTGGRILADQVSVIAAGDVDLSGANSVQKLAASLTHAGGNLTFQSVTSLHLGIVEGLRGVSTLGDVTIRTDGQLTIDGAGAQGIRTPTGLVTLRAGQGMQESVGGTIVADRLVLRGGGSFDLGQNNSVRQLAADVQGSLNFNESDALEIAALAGVNGVRSGGDVTVTSGGVLTVTAPIAAATGSGGTLLVQNAVLNAPLDAGAGLLTLRGGGPDLIVNVVQSTAGNASYSATGNAVINATLAVTTPGARLTILADSDGDGQGDVQLAAGMQLQAPAALQVSGANLLLSGSLSTAHGPIDLLASQNVSLGGATTLLSHGGDIRVMADANLSGQGGIVQTDGSRIDAGAGAIFLSAAGDIQLANARTTNAGAQAVQIISRAGGILDAGDADADIVANTLGSQVTLQAARGIGTANPLETQIANLQATNSLSGDIRIRESGALTLTGLSQLQAGGIDVRTFGGGLTASGDVTTQAGGIHLTAQGTMSNLSVLGTIQSGAGAVQLTADRSAMFGSLSQVRTTSGNVTVLADANGSGVGQIQMDDHARIDAGTGTIALQAAGNIQLGGLKSASAADDAIVVNSQSGAIIDAGDSFVDIQAQQGQAILAAAGGIGSGNALETNVARLTLVNRLSGDVQISETSSLTLMRADQQGSGRVQVETQAGSLTLAALGGGVSTQGGAVSLSANGAGSNLSLQDQISTLGGGIALLAGGDLSSSTAGRVGATGAAGRDAGSIMLSATGSIQLQGDLIAAGAAGRQGGNVTIVATNGVVTLAGVDASGGAAPTGTGGAAGNVSLQAGQAGGAGTSNITLTGAISTLGGAGLTAGADGATTLFADGDILDGRNGQTLISTGDLSLSARNQIGTLTDFAAGTGDAIDVLVRGELQQLLVSAAGGAINLNAQGDLTASTGAIVPAAGAPASVRIVASGNLDVGAHAGALSLDAGDRVSLSAGGILVLPTAGLNVGTGDLVLKGGLDVLNPAGRDLGKFTAGSLTFVSGAAGGTTTLHTAADRLSADLSTAPASAGLTVIEDDGLIVDGIQTSGGDVRVLAARAAAGDLVVHNVNARAGNVLLDATAQGGRVLAGGAGGPDVIANGLAILAARGIGNGTRLEVQVAVLAASTLQGPLHAFDSGDLVLGDVLGVSGVTIAAGGAADDMQVSSTGLLTASRNVSNAAGAILLAADGPNSSLRIDPGVHVFAGPGDVTLLAGGDLRMSSGAVVQNTSGNMELIAGARFNDGGLRTSGAANAALLMAPDAVIASNSGNIVIRALGDVAAARVDADFDGDGIAGNVAISADFNGLAGAPADGQGEIRDAASGPAPHIRAENLSLFAATGIGSADALNLDVRSVTAVNTTQGDIELIQTAPAPNHALIAGPVTNALGNIDLRTLDGDLTATGPISTTQGGSITLTAGDAGRSGDGTLSIQNAISTSAGAIRLISQSDDAAFGPAGNVTSQTGNFVVSAGVSDGSGRILQDPGSTLNAGTGTIHLDAHGQIVLGRLVTSSRAGDAVSLVSADAISSAASSLLNILAPGGRLVVDAVHGVGPLRTTIASLDLTNRGSGAVTLSETNGLDVLRLDQQGPGAADSVTLTTGGTLHLLAGRPGLTAGDGAVQLRATGAASDIVVESSIKTGAGNLSLLADRDVQIGAQGLVQSRSPLLQIIGGGSAGAPAAPAGGGVFMADGALVQNLAGRVDLRGDAGIMLGRVVALTDVRLTSAHGGVADAGDSLGPDVMARTLGVQAASGIGSAHPLTVQVQTLAASNAGSGDIQINNTTGNLLVIGQVADPLLGSLAGLSNSGAGNGRIIVANQGPLTVAAGVSNTSGGAIILTAADNGGDDDHLTVAAPIFASGPLADVKLIAGTDLILQDTPAANDIQARTITGSAGRAVQYQDGFVIRSATGAITAPTPQIASVATPEVMNSGLASINGSVGRPGDQNFVYVITWNVNGPVQTVYHSGNPIVDPITHKVIGTAPFAGTAGFTFEYRYLSNPDKAKPSAPIPINIDIYDDTNITLTAAGRDLGVVSAMSTAQVPGTGIIGGYVFDLSIHVPQIEAPRMVLGEAPPVAPSNNVSLTNMVILQGAADAETLHDDRIIIIEKIGADGQVELGGDQRPIIQAVHGDDAQRLLDDLSGLYSKLKEGHWRISLKEGQDAQPQLIRDVILRNGKPAGNDAGTQDRPPTDSGNSPPPPAPPAPVPAARPAVPAPPTGGPMSLLPAAPAAEISAAAESFTDVVSQSTSPAPQPPVRAGAAIAGLALAIWPQPLRRTVVAVGKRLRRAGILAAFLR